MPESLHEKPREQLDRDFKLLDRLLKTHPLPMQNGKRRMASASEFMWMHQTPEGIRGFKHSNTRNYIFMIPISRNAENVFRLYVPREPSRMFMLGFFDNPRVDFCTRKGCRFINSEPNPAPALCPLCESPIQSFGGNNELP